jgi:hypothetical protein
VCYNIYLLYNQNHLLNHYRSTSSTTISCYTYIQRFTPPRAHERAQYTSLLCCPGPSCGVKLWWSPKPRLQPRKGHCLILDISASPLSQLVSDQNCSNLSRPYLNWAWLQLFPDFAHSLDPHVHLFVHHTLSSSISSKSGHRRRREAPCRGQATSVSFSSV